MLLFASILFTVPAADPDVHTKLYKVILKKQQESASIGSKIKQEARTEKR
jgi:hypothetical protein